MGASANSTSGGVAVGGGVGSFGLRSLSIGTGVINSGTDAIAIGTAVTASAADTVSIGTRAEGGAAQSIALGKDSKVLSGAVAGSIALGANSVADRAGAIGTVSIGSTTLKRQLVNVAAGTQATDAVNKQQLDSVESSLTNLINNVSGASSAFFVTETTDVALAPAATGKDSLAMGANADSKGAASVSMGLDSSVDAKATNGIALGKGAKVIEVPLLPDGKEPQFQTTDAIAIGREAKANNLEAIALGKLFHIYDGGYCQPSEVRGGSHQ